MAGGLSGVRLVDACRGALSILDDRQVSTLREVSGCRVGARVGTLEVRSAPFDVSGLGG